MLGHVRLARGGAVRAHRAFAPHFGLPAGEQPRACRACGVPHADELQLGPLLQSLFDFGADAGVDLRSYAVQGARVWLRRREDGFVALFLRAAVPEALAEELLALPKPPSPKAVAQRLLERAVAASGARWGAYFGGLPAPAPVPAVAPPSRPSMLRRLLGGARPRPAPPADPGAPVLSCGEAAPGELAALAGFVQSARRVPGMAPRFSASAVGCHVVAAEGRAVALGGFEGGEGWEEWVEVLLMGSGVVPGSLGGLAAS